MENLGRGRVFTLFTLICVSLFFDSVLANEDDDLLLLVPSIIAGANKEPELEGIIRVRELEGTWLFVEPSIDPSFSFDYYFKFDGGSAFQSPNDPTVYLIEGESSLFSDFALEWCDGGMVGSYSTEFDSFIILCNWGFPDNDLGTLYSFDAPSANFPFTSFFYTPSTGEVDTDFPTNGTASKISNASRIVPLSSKSGLSDQAHQVSVQEKLVQDRRTRRVASKNQEFGVPTDLKTHLEKVLDSVKAK